MTTMKSILSRLTQAVNGTDKELFSEQELNQFASFYLDKWDENTSEDTWWQSHSWTIGGTPTGLADDALNVAS